MEAVFKQYPNVDVIYFVGEDYYLQEPKHLGENADVKLEFRNEEARIKYEASQGVFTEAERIEALVAEVEVLKAEKAEAVAEVEKLKAEIDALTLENQQLKLTTAKPGK